MFNSTSGADVMQPTVSVPIGDGVKSFGMTSVPVATMEQLMGLLSRVEALEAAVIPATSMFAGWVTDAGGGQVAIVVDRDTLEYPALGVRVRVIVEPAQASAATEGGEG